MINFRKSAICCKTATVLGQTWLSGGYFKPDNLKLKAILNMSEEDLASASRARLFGLLSYFRPYCPDFAARIDEIRKLVSNDSEPWTPQHTKCFR